MPPMRSFELNSLKDWVQTLAPTVTVLIALAFSAGQTTQKLEQIEAKVQSLGKLEAILADQNVDIVIIKKDLSALQYRVDNHDRFILGHNNDRPEGP